MLTRWFWGERLDNWRLWGMWWRGRVFVGVSIVAGIRLRRRV